MAPQRKRNTTINARMQRLALAIVLVFLVIAVCILAAFQQIRSRVDLVVSERIQSTVENSRNSRDFGLFYSRLSVFRNNFYGKQEYLLSESDVLLDQINALRARINDSQMDDLLSELHRQLGLYTARGEWINSLLAWRQEQQEDLDDLLHILQEFISEQKAKQALTGEDIRYFDELSMLTFSYESALLDIARRNAEEDRSSIMGSRIGDDPPLAAQLDNLVLRLGRLTSSDPQIARFGHHLISRVEYYKYLMRHYQLELIYLNRQGSELNMLTGEILYNLESHDDLTTAMAVTVSSEIKSTLQLMATALLVLLVFLAVLFRQAYTNLFKKHILAPMIQVEKRLSEFQSGDHTTMMDLKREDEWSNIEAVFNETVVALQESLEALRDSEKRYRGLFTNAMEGIFRVDSDGYFIDLNPAALAALACDSLEDARRHYGCITTTLYVDSTVRERMLRRLAVAGRTSNFETLVKRRNGEQFWCVINNYMVRDEEGNFLYIEGTMRDVSVRRNAQLSLQRIRNYLQNIIDSIPSILIALDGDMKVSLWNRKAEQENRLRAQLAEGQSLGSVSSLFPADVYSINIKQVMETRQQLRLSKVKSLKTAEDGSERFFDLLIFPMSDIGDDGVGLLIDEVTERVFFEEGLVRSQKMQSVGRLASGLAHEINNPLAAILQNVQVLRRRLSPELNKNVEVAEQLGISVDVVDTYMKERGCDKMLRSITDAGQRAARIVANMQSFSRQGEDTFASCALGELIERTLDLVSSDYDMRYHYSFQKIEIVRQFDSVPDVYCESSHIQQALLNLFKNAAQAMNGQEQPPRLTIRLFSTDRQHVCIQIEDNGPGMAAETVEHIFDPFYSTREVGLGAGLGLSVAYFIITQTHGGEFSLSSSPGQGSRFDIVLPLKSA